MQLALGNVPNLKYTSFTLKGLIYLNLAKYLSNSNHSRIQQREISIESEPLILYQIDFNPR